MVKISVIIPTYNESKYIGGTLKALKEQSFKDIEVILADDNSDDGTREIAKRVYPSIKISNHKRIGPTKSFNVAAKDAKGDLLVFIDADTEVTKNMLASYYNAFGESDIVAATGPIIPLEKTTFAIRMGFSVVSVGIVRVLLAMGMPSLIGSNTAVRADAFKKVHGFNTSLHTYYDWDLSKRLGKIGKITFVKGAIAKTSVRRVKKWGVLKYFTWHASNFFVYNLFHTARSDYEEIR